MTPEPASALLISWLLFVSCFDSSVFVSGDDFFFCLFSNHKSSTGFPISGFTFNFPTTMRRGPLFYGLIHIFVKTNLHVAGSLFKLVVVTDGGNVVDNHAPRKEPIAEANGQNQPNFSLIDGKPNP